MNRLAFVVLVMLAGCSRRTAETPPPSPSTIVVAEAKTGSEAPKAFTLALERRFKSVKLDLPVWLQPHPTKKGIWYALEQRGNVVRFDETAKSKRTRVLRLIDRVRYGGERGLLGMALHPKFPEEPYMFVNYTHEGERGLETRVSRFESNDHGMSFDPESESILLTFEQPHGNHNGGQLLFGPDGFLYIGVGDGGSAGDPNDNGQNAESLLGSILRIDINEHPYAIPRKNPFAKHDTKRHEIWAYGLRNPWRMSFDLKTGDLWAADVGQNAWEEINLIRGGGNYGWHVMEGNHCFEPKVDCDPRGLESPLFEYGHDAGDASITGGYVYRGKALSELVGKYIYADFVSGRIWYYDPATKASTQLFDTDFGIATFAQDHDGELYVVDYGAGAVYALVPAEPPSEVEK